MEEHTYSFGCIPDKKDVRDYKIDKRKAQAMVYPDAFECEKKARVKNQGNVGSCTAHASSTILEHHYVGKEKRLSTNFLYGIHYKLFGSEGPGLRIREALNIMRKYGDPEIGYCPGNTEVAAVYTIAEDAFKDQDSMENAKFYRIDSYAKLVTNDDIKFALMNYGPVIGCIKWFGDSYLDEQGILMIGEQLSAYHAIVIYGWNELGWLCQNSWGATWGKKGYFILPYEYGIEEAYSVIPMGVDSSAINKPVNNFLLNIIYKLLNLILNAIEAKM